ncbi:hypothetical protein DFJ58DRAFT_878706 [Suillus subalutaceus]|uniref:uncharacterized protein n=1 Tax=Suillus subalutaceus TaxID=48586 RepID=UPI001B86AEBC|nr:uncharacterized protein DFJ58DRAFT_878706 [Suillus subalutaceus]KAG1856956.1 hypothetical protein DFJ58DRAFT_878706 [Suillus subalutaceus]
MVQMFTDCRANNRESVRGGRDSYLTKLLPPQMKGPLPSVIALQATPSDIELLLLRSIEWTTFEDGMYDTALEQATVILYVDRVVECQSLEVSLMNRDTRVAWLGDYKGLMDQAYDAVVKLLTSD